MEVQAYGAVSTCALHRTIGRYPLVDMLSLSLSLVLLTVP